MHRWRSMPALRHFWRPPKPKIAVPTGLQARQRPPFFPALQSSRRFCNARRTPLPLVTATTPIISLLGPPSALDTLPTSFEYLSPPSLVSF